MIRTPDQRLRVFISSTLDELAPERAGARRAVEQLRLAPVMFELAARSHPPRALYKAYVEQSDVFVGIYWQQYGWVAPGMDVSGLEDEYFLGSDKPRLVYVKRPAPEIDPRLAALLSRIEDDALTCYRPFETPDELHTVLADDLAVLLSEGFGWDSAGPPADDQVGPASRLPVPLTRMIDREHELDHLCAELGDRRSRLVTITGAGGTGKTRLALETARRVGGGFPGGVHFVDLSAIRSVDRFLAELARALGATPEGNRSVLETIVDRLRSRETLLLLDNFEQIADAAPAVASILAACPHVSALVTSRVPLLVRGEHEYRATPLPAAAAAELFAERAAEASPAFTVTPENAADVAEICRRVDGLPLAVELAAARVRILTPAALVERLGQRLDLAAELADLPERQRTLRATIAWSYELLDDSERSLFAKLAVFAGGFTLNAVEAICADEGGSDTLETLSSLVEKSLVTVDAPAAEPRFRMLETVREYALERLVARPDTDLVERRHAEYYVDLCEETGPQLEGPEQALGFARLDTELGNFRALFDWAQRTGEPELIVRVWGATMTYWWVRDLAAEMSPILEGIMPLPASAPASVRADASWLLGICRLMPGDAAASRPPFEEALAIAREADDPRRTVLALCMLGAVTTETTGADGAWARHREALAIARRLDWRWGIAYTLHHLGDTAIRARDIDAVIAFDTECLSVARELGDGQMSTMALWQLGWAYAFQGDHPRARELLEEAAANCLRMHNVENISYCLDGLATVMQAAGDTPLAARLAGAADGARAKLRMAPFPPLAAAVVELRAPIAAALGDDAFERERAVGASLSPEDALAQIPGAIAFAEVSG